MAAAWLRRAWNDPLLHFVMVVTALYSAWYLLYELVLHPWGGLDRALIDNLVQLGGWGLRLFGYEVLPDIHTDNLRYLGAQGGSYLWIGDACNGLSLFAVFTMFMVAFPGPWRTKLWFTPLALFSLHLVNALRVTVLCITATIDLELFNFQHDYTFYVIVYGWAFGLWYFWVMRFAPKLVKASST